jgi:hypothetical protein
MDKALTLSNAENLQGEIREAFVCTRILSQKQRGFSSTTAKIFRRKMLKLHSLRSFRFNILPHRTERGVISLNFCWG